MKEAFLIVISLLGVGYAVWTKQGRVALGFLILAISFVLGIPELVTSFWSSFLGAISLILFLVGVLVIVWKKKETSKLEEKPEVQETKE